MDITVGFLILVTICIWMGLLLTNVRKIRKAAESTAAHAAYQSQLAHDRAVAGE